MFASLRPLAPAPLSIGLALLMTTALTGCSILSGVHPASTASPRFSVEYTNRDGYTYTVTGVVPDTLGFRADPTHAKPGQTNLVGDLPQVATVTIKNTTAKRVAPMPTLDLVPVYAADSIVLQAEGPLKAQKVTLWATSGLTVADYATNATLTCANYSWGATPETIEVDGVRDSRFTSVTAVSSMYPTIAVKESEAEGLLDALNHPAGWILRAKGDALPFWTSPGLDLTVPGPPAAPLASTPISFTMPVTFERPDDYVRDKGWIRHYTYPTSYDVTGVVPALPTFTTNAGSVAVSETPSATLHFVNTNPQHQDDDKTIFPPLLTVAPVYRQDSIICAGTTTRLETTTGDQLEQYCLIFFYRDDYADSNTDRMVSVGTASFDSLFDVGFWGSGPQQIKVRDFDPAAIVSLLANPVGWVVLGHPNPICGPGGPGGALVCYGGQTPLWATPELSRLLGLG